MIDAISRHAIFYYLDQDRCAGRCPRCGGIVGVEFIGRTTDVNLHCQHGCPERDIWRAIVDPAER
jgi:hypothetical protein